MAAYRRSWIISSFSFGIEIREVSTVSEVSQRTVFDVTDEGYGGNNKRRNLLGLSVGTAATSHPRNYHMMSWTLFIRSQ